MFFLCMAYYYIKIEHFIIFDKSTMSKVFPLKMTTNHYEIFGVSLGMAMVQK